MSHHLLLPRYTLAENYIRYRRSSPGIKNSNKRCGHLKQQPNHCATHLLQVVITLFNVSFYEKVIYMWKEIQLLGIQLKEVLQTEENQCQYAEHHWVSPRPWVPFQLPSTPEGELSPDHYHYSLVLSYFGLLINEIRYYMFLFCVSLTHYDDYKICSCYAWF